MSSGIDLPQRILVVEDDANIRKMVATTFGEVCDLFLADNGREAFELMRRERPDFVITDLMVPGMSGIELIDRARRTSWGALIPILVLTANASEDTVIECFNRGADDFMLKPFSLQELRVRVASIHVRQLVARDRNPLTGIPGNLVIRREVEARIADQTRFCLAALDLDHFKAFNDSRGFDAGDEVICMFGELLEEYALEHGDDDTFVGHTGGDDFVVLLGRDQVDGLAHFVHERFALNVRDFYEAEEVRAGTVDIVNRHGETECVPLLSVSIGVVDSIRHGLCDFRHFAQVATEVKKVAKSLPGNSLFIDRRLKE